MIERGVILMRYGQESRAMVNSARLDTSKQWGSGKRS